MLHAEAARDAGALPAALRHLRDLGAELARLDAAVARNLRVIVTVPTLRLGGVVAALGAALADVGCRGCAHTRLEPGVPVTGWASGKFIDGLLTDVTDDELTFGGIRLRGHRETVHRLPAGFPVRRDWRLPDDVRADVASALGCSPAVAGQRLSASAAHPVVVAGEPSAVRSDVEELSAVSAGLHLNGRLHAGGHLHDWFRHPVLLMGAVPHPEEVPWAKELRPRLVVITGSAGWVGSSRRNWPDVPVLVLLPRRSPAGCDAAGLICASGWTPPVSVPAPLAPLLQPAAGLEVLCRVEPEAAGEDEDLW